MPVLTHDQKDQFWRDGVLVLEDAVAPEELTQRKAIFTSWVEDSRSLPKGTSFCVQQESPDQA